MDEASSVTGIRAQGETIIFQLALNDFFNVMANQHELAQRFINSVTKKITAETN